MLRLEKPFDFPFQIGDSVICTVAKRFIANGKALGQHCIVTRIYFDHANYDYDDDKDPSLTPQARRDRWWQCEVTNTTNCPIIDGDRGCPHHNPFALILLERR